MPQLGLVKFRLHPHSDSVRELKQELTDFDNIAGGDKALEEMTINGATLIYALA